METHISLGGQPDPFADRTLERMARQTASRTAADRAADENTPITLEVVRGKTRFPRRKITEGNFLIGADSDCDLRLGGDEMPPLHSVIHLEQSGAWLESLAPAPTLSVNGHSVRAHHLEDGDRIRIGEFEFLAHYVLPTVRADHAVPDDSDAHILPMLADDGDNLLNLGELSPAELVELIEREEAQVREFETRRALGAAALWQAVQEQIEELDAEHDEAPLRLANPEPTQLPRQVAQLRTLLDARMQGLMKQEALFTAAASQLLDAQQSLAQQIESLLQQLAAITPVTENRSLRASA